MIRGKRLRPLATVSDKPLELEGYGTIPPLSQTLPGFTAPANYFGIFIPEGRARRSGQDASRRSGPSTIAKSEALKKYATSRGALFAPLVRRGRAEGRVPGGAGQRLAAVQRRQGEGLARHGRHPEALSRARRSTPCRRRDAPCADLPRRGRAPSPRSDLRGALGWMVFGVAVLVGSVTMDRLEQQDINPYTVPGPAARAARHRDDPAGRRARRCAAGGAARCASAGAAARRRARAARARVCDRHRPVHRLRAWCWSATACRSGSASAIYVDGVDPPAAAPAAATADERR